MKKNKILMPFNFLISMGKSMLRKVIPGSIKHQYKLRSDPQYFEDHQVKTAYQSIKGLPRYTKGTVAMKGVDYYFVDNASFIFTYEEIFRKEIYKFHSSNPKPYIIDAGANIGLSVLYFKSLFPQSTIVAFEPDDQVFEVLQANLSHQKCLDVTTVKKALWSEQTELTFFSEGADGGRLEGALNHSKTTKIQTVRLSEYLKDTRVDFLKIDIEGAEFEVIKEAASLLKNVSRMFVEYHSFVGQPQNLPELLQILKDAGFRLNINTPGLVSANPFLRVNQYNGMDMQLNIYAYRV